MIEGNRCTGIFIQGKCSEGHIYSTKPSPRITFSMAILIAIIINGMLFTGASLMNKSKPIWTPPEPIESLILIKHTPPAPPLIPESSSRVETPPESINSPIEKTKSIYVPAAPPIFSTGDISNTVVVPYLKSPSKLSPVNPGGPYEPFEVDIRPQLIRHIQPFYPFSAKRKNIEGQVTVRFVVDKTGMVLNPVVIKATPEGVFEESALNAVSKWRFKPAMLNKEPVDVYVVVPLTFELN